MRVLLVLGTAAGGVGVHVASLARSLAADGVDVVVGAPAATRATFDFGVPCVEVPVRRAGTELLAVPALRRASRDVDVVHAHGLRAGVAAALARRHPLVVSWHNAVLATGTAARLGRTAETLVARAADVTLAASADLAATAAARGARDVRIVPVSPPPVPIVRGGPAVRAELGLTPDQRLVLSVGRLHPQKDPAALVRLASRWTDGRTVLAVAGDGPSRPGVEALIASTGAPVRLLGRRNDVGDLLAAADLFVLASVWDARPLALQEAMRAGVPVVATAVGGVPELVGTGVAGTGVAGTELIGSGSPAARLVPPGAADDLAAAVDALLADDAARAALGRAGAAHAAREWPDERVTARAVLAVYEELIGVRDRLTRRRRGGR